MTTASGAGRPKLARFLEKQARRAAGRVDLAAALLSDRGLRYLFARGWLLFARLPLRVGLHVAEVVVLSDFLELGMLGYLLALRSGAVALGALHWGALEPLRQFVRRESGRGEYAHAELEIARYLRLSIDYCVVILILVVVGLRFGPRPFESFSIIDAYAIGCGLRAMSESLVRTYHAGAFALRRVYRPFAASIAVDVVDVGTTLVLWPWLGPWGFAVAQILGGVVEACLTLVYTRRAYADLRLSPPSLARALSEKSKPAPGTLRRLLLPALGNLGSQIDALLITTLAFGVSQGAATLAAALHVLRPVLSIAGNWARLSYFDLSRLAGPLQTLIRARLERLLWRAAPVFALASVALALLLGALMAGSLPWQIAWFLPFMVARFWYAVAQVQAFARGKFGALLVGAALMAALAVAAPALSARPLWLLALATATLVAAALVLRWLPGREPPSEGESLRRPLEFLAELARAPEPVRLHVLVLGARMARPSGVARALAALPSTKMVTRIARRRALVWSEPDLQLSAAALIEAAGGSLRSVTPLDARSGTEGLHLLLERGLLGAPFDEGSVADEAELRREFTRQFPAGTILSGQEGVLSGRAATPRLLTATLAELRALASGSWLSRRRGLRAAVYAPGGRARTIFVASPDADADAFAAFDRAVLRASVVGCSTAPPRQ